MKKYIKPEIETIITETTCNLLAGSPGYGNQPGDGWHAPKKKPVYDLEDNDFGYEDDEEKELEKDFGI